MLKSVPPKKAATPAVSSPLITQSAELRRLRSEAGLTQEELATACSLSVYAIAGYEQGRFGMKVSALNKIAEALGTALARNSSELLVLLAQDHQS